MPKNIVICCDGTNNEISGNQTNVLRLFRMLVRDESQVAFYDPGVGTHADPTAHRSLRRRIYQKLDVAVGLGVRNNVLDAYRLPDADLRGRRPGVHVRVQPGHISKRQLIICSNERQNDTT